jgi:peptidoglycan/LPS O-acetylase OafA/YrhL
MGKLLNIHKNYKLELVRGAAAIFVFLNHFVGLYKPLQEKGGAAISLISNWGVEAVVIFFILSGIVINMSQSNNPKITTTFIVNRIKRIYPLFALGLVLGLIAGVLVKLPAPSFTTITGNIFMQGTLQGYIVPVINTNVPAWSLTFEMVFYLLFSLIIMSNSHKYLLLWGGIAIVAIIFYTGIEHYSGLAGHVISILAFSAIWLWGYMLFEHSSKFSVNIYVALFSLGLLPIVSRLNIMDNYYDIYKFSLFALLSSPFFIYLIGKPGGKIDIKLVYLIPVYAVLAIVLFINSRSLFLSKCLYVTLPVVLLTAGYLIKKLLVKSSRVNLVNKFSEAIGKHSYAVYILHYPVLLVCSGLIHNTILYIIISVFSVAIITYLAEKSVQPAVVKIFR